MRTALAAVLAAAVLAGCSSGGGGGNTVNWYVFKEPGGSYDEAAATCSQQSNGRYHIKIVDLPTDADVQRQQLVRRLAAKDSSVDIVGMDVIWTGEFAEAGWIQPFPTDKAAALSKGVLPGPLATGTYKDHLYAAPLTSNTQLLWYRKDRVPKPPATWDELIDQAIQLKQQTGQPNYVEVQANRYEGYTVWFNAMLAGAGGQIVTTAPNGEATASLEQAP